MLAQLGFVNESELINSVRKLKRRREWNMFLMVLIFFSVVLLDLVVLFLLYS